MASFGDRRDNIGSFGRRSPAEGPEEIGPDPALEVGRTTIVVNVDISPESLQKITSDVAEAVRQGVEHGFATAGTPQLDVDEDKTEPG